MAWQRYSTPAVRNVLHLYCICERKRKESKFDNPFLHSLLDCRYATSIICSSDCYTDGPKPMILLEHSLT